WLVVGGTSASSPFVASVFALYSRGTVKPDFMYSAANASAFNDVLSGTNGPCGNVLCNAGKGWDGPTGVGTPYGKALAAVPGAAATGSGALFALLLGLAFVVRQRRARSIVRK